MTGALVILLSAIAFATPDRSTAPVVAPPVPMDLPDPEIQEISPGLTVWHVRVPGLRNVGIEVIRDIGSLDIESWPGAAATATGWLQDVATRDLSPEDLAILQDMPGLTVRTWLHFHHSGATVFVPRQDLRLGIDVLRQVMVEPTFPRQEVRRSKRVILRHLEVDGPTSPQSVISSALTYAWFPADHVLGLRPDWLGWKKLRRRDLQLRHRLLSTPAPTTVMVVGDVDLQDVTPLLQVALQHLAIPGDATQEPSYDPQGSAQLIAIDFPESSLVQLALRTPAPTSGQDASWAARLVDHAVAGHTGARINQVLRDRGLIYDASSTLHMHAQQGHWTLQLTTSTERASEVMQVVEEQLDLAADQGLSPSEITSAQRSLIHWWNTRLQHTSSALTFYAQRQRLDQRTPGLPALLKAEVDQAQAAIRQTTESMWRSKHRVWVVLGDGAALDSQLHALGRQPRWISTHEAILGAW